MAILDDVWDHEFEALMADVFRHLGYENIRRPDRTAADRPDLLMEEVVDGRRRAVLVECKHTETVGRSVVRKLHSAVGTHDGPARGIVATTGRFTGPAREYAATLGTRRDGGMELLDGQTLGGIGEEIGVDLRTGRIEIRCEDVLRPTRPTAGRDAPVSAAVREIDNLDLETATVPPPETTVTLEPVLTVRARTAATFETDGGAVQRIDETNEFAVRAGPDGPKVAPAEVRDLVTDRQAPRIDLEAQPLEGPFDRVEREPFGRTETGYREWAIDRLQREHTTTVRSTDDDGVAHETVCTPDRSAVSIEDLDPVYAPHVRSRLSLGEYEYRYAYYAAGSSRSVTTNELHRCVHCGTDEADETYTYCANCGSINCEDHIATERLEGEPVCTGCAVTERFALRTKYFYDEANLEAFREEYEAMPRYRKALENVPLVAGFLLCILFAAFLAANSFGLV